MTDSTEHRLINEVKVALASVTAEIKNLSVEQAASRAEVREVKDRLLDDLSAVIADYRELNKKVTELHGDVAALKSRQAPLSTPAAWIALVVSALVASKQFLGF